MSVNDSEDEERVEDVIARSECTVPNCYWCRLAKGEVKEKLYTEEDMKNAFKSGESNKKVQHVSYGMLGGASQSTFRQTFKQWLEEYKTLPGK